MATAKVGRVKPRQRPGDRLILHGKEMTPPPAPPSPPGLPPAEDSETEEELKAKYKLEELEIKTTLGECTARKNHETFTQCVFDVEPAS